MKEKWRPSPRTFPAARYGAAPDLPRSAPVAAVLLVPPRAIAAHLAALPSSPQDGYVKWDEIDIDSLKLPAGDDMGIARCVQAKRGSRARDRDPARTRSTLKRDPKRAFDSRTARFIATDVEIGLASLRESPKTRACLE